MRHRLPLTRKALVRSGSRSIRFFGRRSREVGESRGRFDESHLAIDRVHIPGWRRPQEIERQQLGLQILCYCYLLSNTGSSYVSIKKRSQLSLFIFCKTKQRAERVMAYETVGDFNKATKDLISGGFSNFEHRYIRIRVIPVAIKHKWWHQPDTLSLKQMRSILVYIIKHLADTPRVADSHVSLQVPRDLLFLTSNCVPGNVRSKRIGTICDLEVGRLFYGWDYCNRTNTCFSINNFFALLIVKTAVLRNRKW